MLCLLWREGEKMPCVTCGEDYIKIQVPSREEFMFVCTNPECLCYEVDRKRMEKRLRKRRQTVLLPAPKNVTSSF